MHKHEDNNSPAHELPSEDAGDWQEISQEVIIHRDGTLEIAWFSPAATPLVLGIWEAVNGNCPFYGKFDQNSRIFCG